MANNTTFLTDQLNRLKRDLKIAKDQVQHLTKDLNEKEFRLIAMEDERNKYLEEVKRARQILQDNENVLNIRVEQQIAIEKAKMQEMADMINRYQSELKLKDEQIYVLKKENEKKEEDIQFYARQINEIANTHPELGIRGTDLMFNLKNYRDEKIKNEKLIIQYTKQLNQLSDQMDHILAENRFLRELAQVPDNFGNLEEIKLLEREKVEDYHRMIKVLDTTLEQREEEIAQLKHQIIQLSTLYADPGRDERYRGLTPEQLHLVDQYALNLKNGRIEPPLNDKSRELQKEIDRLNAKIEFLENKTSEMLEGVIAKISGSAGFTKSAKGFFPSDTNLMRSPSADPKLLETIRVENQDLFKKVIELVENVKNGSVSGGNNIQQGGIGQTMWPPVPVAGPFGNWNDIREGISYRFKKTKLKVDLSDDSATFDQTAAKYEIATLQLHNLENMELIARKESELKGLNAEIEEMREEMKKCLLVQDSLFKQYGEEKKEYERKIKEFSLQNGELMDRNSELDKKLKLIEDLASTLTRGDTDGLKAKLNEFAKKISIQEVNLIRLSRKYETLKHEETTLRESYDKIAVDFAEREEDLMQKLTTLQRWKIKASAQLKILFNLQQNSTPKDEYEILREQYQVVNEKYSEWKIKEVEYKTKISQLELEERELHQKNEIMKELQEDLLELDLEFEIIKNRLEECDPTFKRYQTIFRNLIQMIKERNITPLQLYELFDKNKNNKIGIREFEQALQNMRIYLNKNDIDIIFNNIDIDGSGTIELKEFLKKLRRSGIKMRGAEEDLVYQIYEVIRKANLTPIKAFEIFDRNGDKLITKTDMKEVFDAMNFGVSDQKITDFFSLADVDGDGSITCEEFTRLFEKMIKDVFVEEKKVQIEELSWNMQTMINMDTALKANRMTLLDAFKMLDDDDSGTISYDELKSIFINMQMNISAQEIAKLFSDIDNDKNGYITYSEFQEYMNKAKVEGERIKRLKNMQEKISKLKEDQSKAFEEYNTMSNMAFGGKDPYIQNDQIRLQMKISILETREKNAIKQMERLKTKLNDATKMIEEMEDQIKELQSDNIKLNEDYHTARERELKLIQQVSGSVSKMEADQLRNSVNKLLLEKADVRSMMLSFKALYESSVSMVKSLKISQEKKKHEIETMFTTIKDLQMNSDEAALIGKLHHQLMVSKWNAGQVNKKYEDLIDQIKSYRTDVANYEIQLNDREETLMALELTSDSKIKLLEKTISDLKFRIIPNVSSHKIEEITNKIKEITNQKSDLEIYNKQLRQQIHDMGVRLDYFELHEKTLTQLSEDLKLKNVDEISQLYLDVSMKLSEYKLAELRAKRDAHLYEQKEEYLQKVLRQQGENVKKLEEELAAWDLKAAQREDFWRKRYNEATKLIFNPTNQPLENREVSSTKSKTDNRQGTQYLQDISKKNEDISNLQKKVAELELQLQDRNLRIQEMEKQMSISTQAPLHIQNLTKQTATQINSAIHEEETRKFAFAAHKTIETLQELVNEKNESLKKKDELIERMKKEYLQHKEMDTQEIQRLNDYINELNKAQAIQSNLDKNKSKFFESRTLPQLDLADIDIILEKKDREIEKKKAELKANEKLIQSLQGQVNELLGKIRNLEVDLDTEKNRNDIRDFKEQIANLKKKVSSKDEELKSLREGVNKFKEELSKIRDNSEKKESDLTSKLHQKSSDAEIQMKMATKRVQDLDEKIKKMDKELKDYRERELKQREQVTLMKEDVDQKERQLKAKDDTIYKMQKELNDLNKMIDSEKKANESIKMEAYFKEGEFQKTFEAKKEELDNIRRELILLKTGKISGMFDNNGRLASKGLGFENADEIYEKIRIWLTFNPSYNIYSMFKEYDKNGSGFITDNELYEVLESLQIKFSARDKDTLNKDLTKSVLDPGKVDYVEFYKKLKGLNDQGLIVKMDGAQSNTPLRDTAALKRGGSIAKKEIQVKKTLEDIDSIPQIKDIKDLAKEAAKENFARKTNNLLKTEKLTENEKIMQKTIETLNNRITDLMKENDKLEKQLNNWKENYSKLDKEHKNLLSKPISKTSGDIEASKKNIVASKMESIQDLRDKIFELENKISQYDKIIQVEKDPLIKKLKQDKEKLEEEIKNIKAENIKTRQQYENFQTKKLSTEQLRDEILVEKELIISNLKEKLDTMRAKDKALNDKLFEEEQKNMELLLFKQTTELQFDRLRRRIQELEDYKETIKEAGKLQEPGFTTKSMKKTVK